jgi:mono/diheme cytochrome c family protein
VKPRTRCGFFPIRCLPEIQRWRTFWQRFRENRRGVPFARRFATEDFTMKSVTAMLFAAVVLAAVPASAQSAKAQQGAAVFTAQKCTMCHSVAGKGNPKGALDNITAKNKAEHIRQWLSDPEGMRAKTNAARTPAMKAMKLSPDQIDALVAYLTSGKSDKPAAADAERQ